MGTVPSSSLTGRMLRAARLEDAVYEEVEHDKTATTQAGIVVVGTSLLAGIGSFSFGLGGLIVGTLGALGAWGLYAWLTYLIGTKVLRGPQTEADWGQVARVLGFANSPRALLVLVAALPNLAGLINFVVFVWVLVATVVALRAALDFSTGRAIGTAVIGWIAQAIVYALVIGLLIA